MERIDYRPLPAAPGSNLGIITLTTDFGTSDVYVASLKGVILSITPRAQLVDITHDIPPQDIFAGRLAVDDARKYFPRGTVHLAVIDPGVGTKRLPIIVEADGQFFVGPDNGLFGFALKARDRKFWKIRTEAYPRRSATFEGRDVLAPTAAQLAHGTDPHDLGRPIFTIRDFKMPRPKKSPGRIRGQVIAVDRFGNVVTNITRPQVGLQQARVFVEGQIVGPVQRTYADAKEGGLLALWNSQERLEVAVREGSAARVLNVRRGAGVIVRLGREEEEE